MNISHVTVADLARACEVEPTIVETWIEPDGALSDPNLIVLITALFQKTGVEILHDPSAQVWRGVKMPNGWIIRPTGSGPAWTDC